MSTKISMLMELKRIIRSYHADDTATFKRKLDDLASDPVHPVESLRVVGALQRYASLHIKELPDDVELQRIVHKLLEV